MFVPIYGTVTVKNQDTEVNLMQEETVRDWVPA
jgi:hypothetical protein